MDAVGIDSDTYNNLMLNVLQLSYESDGPTEYTTKDGQIDGFIIRYPDARKQPDETYEMIQQARILRAAIERLRPNQRAAVEQALFKGRAKKDIAAAEGISPSRVSQLLDRAIEKLAERMKEAR